MGVSLEPVGPLPASTYWRRRAVLVAALIAAVLLLAKACGGGGEDKPGALTPPETTSSPTPSTPVVPTPSTTATPVMCTAATGLRIVAVADSKSYPLGTTARLSMTISNSGKAPCVIGLGQGALEFRVASGADRIWSSDDCSPGGAQGRTTLAPGAQRAESLSWSLTRSAPGCKGTRAAVKPGTYVLAARVGTTNSDKFSFAVAPKP